jgi:hypothetical protein
VLFSEAAAPIELKITAVEDQVVSATLTGAALRDTTTGANVPVTGTVTGVLQ